MALLPIADDEWVIGIVRRILPSLSTVAVGILVSVMIFATLRRLESKNAEASFNGVAQQRLDALETSVTLTVNNLVSAGALYDASHVVEREEFDRFTVPLLAGNRAIQALEWIPRVPKRSRQKYEEDARHDGLPAFQLTERLSPTQMARAGEREEYFPVFFVAPLKGNEKALGFDLASDPVRREALRSSADSGRLVAGKERIKDLFTNIFWDATPRVGAQRERARDRVGFKNWPVLVLDHPGDGFQTGNFRQETIGHAGMCVVLCLLPWARASRHCKRRRSSPEAE